MKRYILFIAPTALWLSCAPRKTVAEQPKTEAQNANQETQGGISTNELPGTTTVRGKSFFLDEQGKDIAIFLRGDFNLWLNDGKLDVDLQGQAAQFTYDTSKGCYSAAIGIFGKPGVQNFKISDIRDKRSLNSGATVTGWSRVDVGSFSTDKETDVNLAESTQVTVNYSPGPSDFLGGRMNLRALFAKSALYRFDLCPVASDKTRASLTINLEQELAQAPEAPVYAEYLKEKYYVRGFGKKDWAIIPEWELVFKPSNGCYERSFTIPSIDENSNPGEVRHFKIAPVDWTKIVYGAKAASPQVVPAGTGVPFTLDNNLGNLNLILDGTLAGPYTFSLCKKPSTDEVILKVNP